MADAQEPAVPPAQTPPPATPAPDATQSSVDEEVVSQADIDELNSEIERMNKEMVSEDTAKMIELEKEKARKEAEKDFLVNQKIKEQNDLIEAMKKEKEESEKKNAESLEALTRKVNEMVTSKAVIPNGNPFNEPANEPEPQTPSTMSKQTIDDIERASYELFMQEKQRNLN
jgi:hypothetical protein